MDIVRVKVRSKREKRGCFIYRSIDKADEETTTTVVDRIEWM